MRLIDADKLMHDIRNTITEQSSTIDWLNLINRQPTAYDVDKVVEQLKNVSYERFGNAGMSGKNVVNLDDAIEIVKADIDIENNHDKEVYLTALEDYHRLISEECKFMLIKCNPYALHLKEYNDKVLEQLKAGGNY